MADQLSYTDQINIFKAHPAYNDAKSGYTHSIFTRHLLGEDVDLNALDAAVQAFPAKLLEAHRKLVASRVAKLKSERWFGTLQQRQDYLARVITQDLTRLTDDGLHIIGERIDEAYAWNQERYNRFVAVVTNRRAELMEQYTREFKEFGVADGGCYALIATLIESEPKTNRRFWMGTLDEAINAFWAWMNGDNFDFESIFDKAHKLLTPKTETVEEPATADDKPARQTRRSKRPQRTAQPAQADDDDAAEDDAEGPHLRVV